MADCPLNVINILKSSMPYALSSMSLNPKSLSFVFCVIDVSILLN